MALEHRLFLAAPLPADEVASLVARDGQHVGLIAPDVAAEALLGDGAPLRSGAAVAFRFVGSRDWGAQMDEMLWVTLDVLVGVPGDAVLSFQLEEIRLLRRAGELWLSQDDKFWTPARRQM